MTSNSIDKPDSDPWWFVTDYGCFICSAEEEVLVSRRKTSHTDVDFKFR